MTSTIKGYSLRHVVGHLLHRGRVDDACRMLFNTGATGGNVLFDAHAREGDWSGFLQDIGAAALALACASEARPALELKLALLRSTVQNVVSAYPVAAVGARLRAGIWGRDEAIRFALSLANPLRRANALITIAETSSGEDNFRILRTALAVLRDPQSAKPVEQGMDRREGLRRLIALMPEEGRSEVVAEMIASRMRQTLIDVLSLIPDWEIASVVSAGLEMTRAIARGTSEGSTVYSEAMLTEFETGNIEQQLAAAKACSTSAFSVRSPNREDLFAEAMTYAEQTEGRLRLQTLARLCRSAPCGTKAQLVSQILDEGLASDRGVAILARELASDLPEAGLRRLLERARQVDGLNSRISAICRIGRYLGASEWRQIASELVADLESGWGHDNEKFPCSAGKTLASNSGILSEEQVRMLIALFERTSCHKGNLLLALLEGTSGRSEEVVQAGLRHIAGGAKKFEDDQACSRTGRDLMGIEGLHYVNLFVQVSQEDKTVAAKLMAGSDFSLQSSLLPLTEEVARQIRDPVSRIAAVCAIAAQMEEGPERREAVKTACELGDQLTSPNAKLLVGAHLVRVAGREWRERFFEELSEEEKERSFFLTTLKTEVLQEVLPYVEPEIRLKWAETALGVVSKLAAASQEKRKLRTDAPHWISLTAWLPRSERESVEQIMLAEMNLETEDSSELGVMAAMLPYLTDARSGELAMRLIVKRGVLRGPTRGLFALNVLRALPPNGAEGFPYAIGTIAVSLIRESSRIKCEMCRKNFLGAAAVFFDDLSFQEAVEIVSDIDLDWILDRALRELVVRRLHALSRADVLAAWRRLFTNADRVRRSRFLIWVTEMAPTLPLLGGKRMLDQAWRGIADVGYCWP